MGGAATEPAGLPNQMKLLIGAGGIYAAFLYYGSLQEDVFSFVSSSDGSSFKQAWFLQVLEAFANVVVGYAGLLLTGGMTPNMPKKYFALSGCTQVSAKAFTSLALANGLSFPVATLAKSGKMVPVMIGSLLLGGAKYSTREYLQVLAIVLGTAIVGMGKKKASGESSAMGVFFILGSLVFDGVTGGVQKKLKAETALRPGYVPGDLSFDPLGFAPEDSAEFAEMQEKELAHARIGMIAAAIFLLQEGVTKQTWGTYWGLPDF